MNNAYYSALILSLGWIIKTLGFNEVEINKNEPSWIPRTIAIVLDTEKEITYTGSSQIRCDGIPVLREMAKDMNRLRLGEAFTETINKCYERFKENIGEVLRDMDHQDRSDMDDSVVSRLYEEALIRKNPSDCCSIPTPTQNNKILCSAVLGHNFASMDPCIRCQYLYKGWSLRGSPCTPREKREVLRDVYKSTISKWDVPGVYCAETVAAAKIYTLRQFLHS